MRRARHPLDRRRRLRDGTTPAVELIEEATELLRRCPARGWLWYLAGAVPFLLALLFFWVEMSHDWGGTGKAVGGGLGLAAAYLWLKVCQTRFCDHLAGLLGTHLVNPLNPAPDKTRDPKRSGDPRQARRSGSSPAPLRAGPLGIGGWIRLLGAQALGHALALPLLFASLIMVFPFPWVFAFFNSLTALTPASLRSGQGLYGLIGDSWTQALRAPAQNAIITLLLVILAFSLWINLVGLLFFLPSLLKSFTGMHTAITQSPGAFFSSSVFHITVLGIVFFLASPLVKAIHTLRCYYGQSLSTGRDLRVKLASLQAASAYGTSRSGRGPLLSLLTAFTLGMTGSPQAQGQESAGTEFEPSPLLAQPDDLDASIDRVLSKRSYRWRIPPPEGEERDPDSERGWFGTLLEDIGIWVQSVTRSIGDAIERAFEWIDEQFNRNDSDKKGSSSSGGERSGGSSGGAGGGGSKIFTGLLFVLAAILAAGLIFLIGKALLAKMAAAEADMDGSGIELEEIDLEDEDVTASQLPEDEWMRLAREKMAAGDYRLALRALFLATLAHLGDQRILTIARSKSNGDYLREMRYRGRAPEPVKEAFHENVRAFERAWYGWHEVTPETMEGFTRNYERISGNAG